MKRVLAKFSSSFFGKREKTKPAMSNRFFPNNLPELDEADLAKLQIPESHLMTEVNNLMNNITTHLKPVELNGGDGLYLGTAGIAYMYYHLSKVPTFQKQRSQLLAQALEYMVPSLTVAQNYASHEKDVPSFMLGNCGIYAVAAAVYKATNDEKRCDFFTKLYHEAASTCKNMNFLDCGADELFVGRAGYLLGALWMSKETNTNLQIEDLHEIGRVIVTSGRNFAARHKSQSPLMYAYYGVEYLGAAHGLCSILQVLMSVPGYLDAYPADAKDIKSSVDYLLSLQDSEGNFPTATDEINQPQHKLLHWCHGAPGVIYLMAKAYSVWHEDKYLQACEKMGELVWKKGLLKKGPGICHGVAGNGYVFLLLYRLTSNPKHLHRAIAFSQFMESDDFKRHARLPDNPFSLYEGIAGTVCFLADLTAPTQAVFPFFEVL